MKTLQLYLENTVYKKIVTSLSHKQEMYDSIKAAYEIAKKKWLDSINNKIHPMEIEYYKAKKDILKKWLASVEMQMLLQKRKEKISTGLFRPVKFDKFKPIVNKFKRSTSNG